VRDSGAKLAATTHYAELKTFAMTTAGVENASCEFNVETLCPTYRLLIGIPGKSNAFAISKRLGLPDDVIADAKRQMTGESVRFEDVLTQLESQAAGAGEEADGDRPAVSSAGGRCPEGPGIPHPDGKSERERPQPR
jgi:dsDNA-specific endonuclease/ATPase MutS2